MNVTTTYTVVTCPSCAVDFAITEGYEARKREEGDSFYCPSGHSMSYGNSTREQLTKAKDRAARLAARLDQEKAAHEATERSRRAIKGQVTRVKRRIANGVCPCCSRSFADLHAHMETKHPDYASAEA